MSPPKRLPKQVYKANPPNCIFVIRRYGQGPTLVGPAILDKSRVVTFHVAFKPTQCKTARGIKAAITRCRNRLGLSKVVDVTDGMVKEQG